MDSILKELKLLEEEADELREQMNYLASRLGNVSARIDNLANMVVERKHD